MAAVDVTVVLCTRDGARRLGGTLHHLGTALDRAALACEVVVVDNGSTDGTPALLAEAARRDPRVRVVREPHAGAARARNRGAAAAAAAVLLFTDDDVHVPPDWVARMAGPLRSGTADVVTGPAALAGHRHHRWPVPGAAAADGTAAGEQALAGARLGTTRTVLDAVPFDESLGTARYPGGEDAAFGLDARAAGFRHTAVAGAPVEHHPDPARLHPAALAASAVGRGRAEAYLAHHLHGRRAPAAADAARLAVVTALLAARRLAGPGPADEVALGLRRRAAFHRELLALRREAGRAARRAAVTP